MTQLQDAPNEPVHEVRTQGDPVQQRLVLGIAFLVIVGLVGILYGVLSGTLLPSTPRTLVESQLVLLKNAAVTEPKSGSARNAYILALEASGQHGAAMTEYARAVKETAGVERTQVYAAGVSLLFDSKDYNGAIALAKQAVTSDDAARKMVVEANKTKGITISTTSFDQTARVSIMLTSARASGATGDWQAAVTKLTDTLAFDPQAADLLCYRASAYTKLGQKDKAIADYKMALAFIPDYAPALEGLKQLQGK
jgi:tetratricopeptide (TPR) repeat protein